ncbi:cytochrome P450 81Q32 [Ziziphus jujuba]|uniref:Cytochrome P450 81Q32 n=1 Tax=Ziziphus jujuba TaxID=326968 RepID=A0A6P4AVY7_ZIZJJ|nr:cytochrome P450 81Q32 [Ziziphus jujuba]
MEDFMLYAFLSLIIFFLALKLLSTAQPHQKNLPPSPPNSLPIIGHLHLLKSPVHRTLHRLSQKYGPVITLWFGSRRVVVVSSPKAVEECFTKNDIVLANRPSLLMGKHVGYNNTNLVSSPYGDHWRNLRRIGSAEIFSSSRLNMFSDTRKDEIMCLLRKLSRNSVEDFAKVELKSMLLELTINNIMRMVAGKRYFGEEVSEKDEEARHFREIIEEVLAYAGVSHAGDFVPILNWFGNGYEKGVQRLAKSTDSLLQSLIDEHRRMTSGSRKTMIDHLLSLQKSESQYYTDQMIKGFILVMIMAGTETSAVTVEWAMSNLLNHPHILQKAKAELDAQVGQHQLVDESDLSKLPYLQNIISETLRLHPAVPLLLPHLSSDDCTIGKYDIPRDTMLLVNVWAIHKDPKLWEDSESFKPERFEKGETEAYKFIPFGFGRRSCPGMSLAQRVVGLTLASMIQCFDWKKVGDREVDMIESDGLTMPKAVPLVAMCKSRAIIKNIIPLESTGES